MQPQANRERIIIRTSLPPSCRTSSPTQRSLRQIVLNLLSNAIKFTERRRAGDRLDGARPTPARWWCASATPASA